MKTTFWWPFACQQCSVYAGHLGKEQMELHLSQGCTAGRGCFLSTLVWWNWQHILWPIWAMKKGGPCCWWYRGLFHTMGVIINHYNDPIKQPVYRKSIRVFFFAWLIWLCVEWFWLGVFLRVPFLGSEVILTWHLIEVPAGIFPMRFEKAGWRHICAIEYLVLLQYEFIWSRSGYTPKVELEQLAPESHDGKLEDDPFASFLGPDGPFSGASYVSCIEYSYLNIQDENYIYIIYTLQGTNISPKNGILKMIFLFPRWDMLVFWRVYIYISLTNLPCHIGTCGISAGRARCWLALESVG